MTREETLQRQLIQCEKENSSAVRRTMLAEDINRQEFLLVQDLCYRESLELSQKVEEAEKLAQVTLADKEYKKKVKNDAWKFVKDLDTSVKHSLNKVKPLVDKSERFRLEAIENFVFNDDE